MNLGNKINELRRSKNITQEALAAELGVTAAAVSKWEKGYTLPDILMLCALADYFGVTTDELLGRCREKQYGVIAVSTPELGKQIKALAEQNGIIIRAVFDNEIDAAAAIREHEDIACLIIGFLGSTYPELTLDTGDRAINLYLSISDTQEGILSDLSHALRNSN